MWNAEDIRLEADIIADCNNSYQLELRTAAFTCNIPENEQTSDIYELIWLVLDDASGEVIDTIRQSDRRLVHHRLRVGRDHSQGKSSIVLRLRPSMPWVPTDEIFVVISSPEIDDLPPARYVFDIQFGHPSDLPFIGAQWSYGEGADSHGNWFHCKRFRWANNHFDIKLPRSAHGVQLAQLNANVPVPFSVVEANGLGCEFGATNASRWFQQDYRWTVRSAEAAVVAIPAAVLRVAAARAMPGLQADMRELFAAVESIESEVYIDRILDIPVAALLNEGYIDGMSDPAGDPRIALVQHCGRLGSNPPSSLVGTAVVDVVIFIDPAHDQLAGHRLETGAVWLNSAQGAALACRKLGLFARFGDLSSIKTTNPSLIIIPRQVFQSVETIDVLNYASANQIQVLQEADFHIDTMTRWNINDYASYVHRSDWVFEDGTEIPELWKAFVPHFTSNSHHQVLIHAAARNLPIGLRHREFRNEHLLVGSFFYNFFNYGIHTHMLVLEKLLFECLGLMPQLQVFPTAPCSHAAARQDDRVTVTIDGTGAGLFPYHGIARAFSALGAGSRTRLGQTTIRIRGASLTQLNLNVTDGRLVDTRSLPDHAVEVVIDGDEHIQIEFTDTREGR